MHATHNAVSKDAHCRQHAAAVPAKIRIWDTQRVPTAPPGAAPADSGSGGPNKRRWGKGRPYYGRVVAMEGLCNLSKADDKDTVRVEVDLGDSGLRYAPGDALGILPANCPQVPGRCPDLHTDFTDGLHGHISLDVWPIHTVLHPNTGTNVDFADAHAAKPFDERRSTVSHLPKRECAA